MVERRSGTMRGAVLAVGLVLALTAMACSSSDSSSSKSSSSPSTSSSSSKPAASSSSPATGSNGAGATLSSTQNAKIGKAILVNDAGKTVYIYQPDGQSTTSKVPAALQALWPAVTATGNATAGTGVDQNREQLEPQADGAKQVSYNDHLLYTFANDTKPGDANGQGLGNIWFVMSPDGQPITS